MANARGTASDFLIAPASPSRASSSSSYRFWKWRTRVPRHQPPPAQGRGHRQQALGRQLAGEDQRRGHRDNLLGRILDYGDLDVLTAAETGIDRIRMLNHAKDFKKAVLTEARLELEVDGSIRAAAASAPGARRPRARAGGRPAPAPAARATRRGGHPPLTRLAALRDAGTITPEEYEAKKQELLARL